MYSLARGRESFSLSYNANCQMRHPYHLALWPHGTPCPFPEFGYGKCLRSLSISGRLSHTLLGRRQPEVRGDLYLGIAGAILRDIIVPAMSGRAYVQNLATLSAGIDFGEHRLGNAA